MNHILNLGISEKKNLERIEIELNFNFTKRPKGHIYQLKRPPKIKMPQVEHGWARRTCSDKAQEQL